MSTLSRAKSRRELTAGKDPLSPGNTTALNDYVGHELGYCQTEMSDLVHVSRKNNALTSRCPMAVACLSTPYRAICVLGLSSPYGAPLFQEKHDSAHEHNLKSTSTKHQIVEMRLSFCFTFSKGTTRSDKQAWYAIALCHLLLLLLRLQLPHRGGRCCTRRRVVLYYKDYKLSLKTAVESSP